MNTERHPWDFFLPENTCLLLLGSFPPARERWSMDFYYPNIQNDMWRILGLLFYADKDHFLETPRRFDPAKAKAFCREKGLGLGDTAAEVVRLKNNASDKYLDVVRPADIAGVLRRAGCCQALAVTGQKAMDTLLAALPCTVQEPPVGGRSPFEVDGRRLYLYRMPSTSRAYPRPLAEKAEVYRAMFRQLGML